MKRTLLAVLLCGFAAVTLAQTPPTNAPSSSAPAAAPAAANPTCKTQASDKKLAGAAKTSFTKKCVTDAVGT